MSEKHLTEQPWKTLAAQHGVKDTNLQKALAAYDKVDAQKAPRAALDALKEISDWAVKVKKANAAKDQIVDYIDEILKELKSIRDLIAELREILSSEKKLKQVARQLQRLDDTTQVLGIVVAEIDQIANAPVQDKARS